MKPLFYFLIIALFLGCNMHGSNSPSAQLLRHPNSLRVSVDFGYAEVVQNKSGFLVYIAPKNARQQNQIKIEYHDHPPVGLIEEKEIAGIKLKFKNESVNEGTGGEERMLTIWKPVGASKGVLIEHYVQGESPISADNVWALAVASE